MYTHLKSDSEIFQILKNEIERQQNKLELIASENFVSPAVLEAWRERAKIKGKRVNVTSFGEVLSGVALDVDSDGALILETKVGEMKRIVAGDVAYT